MCPTGHSFNSELATPGRTHILQARWVASVIEIIRTHSAEWKCVSVHYVNHSVTV